MAFATDQVEQLFTCIKKILGASHLSLNLELVAALLRIAVDRPDTNSLKPSRAIQHWDSTVGVVNGPLENFTQLRLGISHNLLRGNGVSDFVSVSHIFAFLSSHYTFSSWARILRCHSSAVLASWRVLDLPFATPNSSPQSRQQFSSGKL